MERMKAQISTELLLIIGLMLFLLVPLLYYAYSRANIAQEDIAVQKSEFSAERLASLADSVGYLGGAAAIVDEIEIPTNVQSVMIDPADTRDVVFTIDSSTGTKQIVKSSAFRIKDDATHGIGKISQPGTYWVEVAALPFDDQSGAQVSMTVK